VAAQAAGEQQAVAALQEQIARLQDQVARAQVGPNLAKVQTTLHTYVHNAVASS